GRTGGAEPRRWTAGRRAPGRAGAQDVPAHSPRGHTHRDVAPQELRGTPPCPRTGRGTSDGIVGVARARVPGPVHVTAAPPGRPRRHAVAPGAEITHLTTTRWRALRAITPALCPVRPWPGAP